MSNTPRPGKANPKESDGPDQQEKPQHPQASSSKEAEQEQPSEGRSKASASKKVTKKAAKKAGAVASTDDGGKEAAPATLPNVPIGALVDARFNNANMHTTEALQSIERCDEAIRVAAQVLVNASRPEARDHALHQLRLAQLSIRDAIGRSGR
jgi:hypothetical protein